MNKEIDQRPTREDETDELYGQIVVIENRIFEKMKMDEALSETSTIEESTPMEQTTLEDIFDEDFLLDLEEEIYRQIDEYQIENIFHIDHILKNKIADTVFENTVLSIHLIFEDTDTDIDSLDEDEIRNFIKERIDIYFDHIFNFPQIPRSIRIETFDETQYIPPLEAATEFLREKLEFLKNQYQPEQRTPEWYEFRSGLMTASNMYKILGTQSQYNSFICEKCAPVNETFFVNTDNSPRHWGQKYEKLSLQIYESMYGTEVSEYGCIRHPKYAYIGASPDGIVTGGNPVHYGRMIEIKNIVNREITGVPLEAYWVQMQIQMEVCDLDICNFIETRFKECETEEDWIKVVNKKKGVVISNIPIGFIKENVKPEYEFIVYEDTSDAKSFIEKWSSDEFEVRWWYMDEFSCVVVPRNRKWFETVLPKFTEAWDTILREKETGEYKSRLPKKKTAKTKCLIPTDTFEIEPLLQETPDVKRIRIITTTEFDNNTVFKKCCYDL